MLSIKFFETNDAKSISLGPDVLELPSILLREHNKIFLDVSTSQITVEKVNMFLKEISDLID